MPAWLEDTYLMDYASELTAALVALGILLLVVAAFRRRSRSRRADHAEDTARQRLAVLEWAVVDERRRLVLIQRDGVEHLILIGGPTDVVVESHIGASAGAVPAAASPKVAAPRPAPAVAPSQAEAPPPVLVPPAPEPASAARAAPPGEPSLPAPEPRAPESAPAGVTPKARPPLAAVPTAGTQGSGKVAPLTPAAEGPRRVNAAGDHPRVAAEGDGQTGGNRRQAATARKEPSLPAGGTSRWAGPGQAAQITLGEPANTQERIGGGRDIAARAAPPAQDQDKKAGEDWGKDDIEGEIVRALRVDPFPPLAFPASAAASSDRAAQAGPILKIGGAATVAPGATLGDLAEKLEEALAREVRTASQGRTRLDLDLDAFTAGDRSLPPGTAPAPVVIQEPAPETRREPQAAIDQHDDPPVISLSARRRDVGDPLEDEMARLLGELTDGARR